VEYIDEPALVLMLCDLPPASFRLFSGRQPMPAGWADSALVHADPATHDLDDLLVELAGRTASGYLFGGLTAARTRRLHIADGVFEGGLSGVAFLAHDPADPVPAPRLVSRVTQGCQPLGPTRHITAADGNLALTLDGQPALALLLGELQVSLQQPQQAMAALRATLVGLTDGGDAALSRGGQFGSDTRVRHLIGIDPARQGIAIAEHLQLGQQFAFCRRDVAAARRDLVRICAEVREEIESAADALPPPDGTPAAPQPVPRIVGAVYVSCSGRGGPHFGAPSAEAQLVQHALGDVPLVGFFAAGEIARHHIYGYTGVLTVFTAT
jgi:small ligand-binding sensory domain FIST